MDLAILCQPITQQGLVLVLVNNKLNFIILKIHKGSLALGLNQKRHSQGSETALTVAGSVLILKI